MRKKSIKKSLTDRAARRSTELYLITNNSISSLTRNNQEEKRKILLKCIKLGHKHIPAFIKQGGLYGQ